MNTATPLPSLQTVSAFEQFSKTGQRLYVLFYLTNATKMGAHLHGEVSISNVNYFCQQHTQGSPPSVGRAITSAVAKKQRDAKAIA